MREACGALLAVALAAAVRADDQPVPVFAPALDSVRSQVVRSAAADLRTLAREVRPYVRYLTDYAVPEAQRAELELLLRVHVNSLSTEGGSPIPPDVLGPVLYRVEGRLYGPNFLPTWDKLAEADPFFHSVKEVVVRNTRTGERRVKREVVLGGPLLTPEATEDLAFLAAETHSQAPIVWADWFYVQTSQQENRVAGYYDFLGVKDRNDFFQLAGVQRDQFNRAISKKKREVAAIIKESGIAEFSRQVFRIGAEDDGYWFTKDVFNVGKAAKNATAKLDREFEHDAEEHITPLPNGLLAYFLSNAAGVRQNSAPDKVGGNRRAPTNDLRIDCYNDCKMCHTEGLRPLDDYARKVFQPPGGLARPVYDPKLSDEENDKLFKKWLRESQLYVLGELQRPLLSDNQKYAYELMRLTGWTPQKESAAYTNQWKLYQQSLDLNRAALGWGVPPQLVKDKILLHLQPPPIGRGPGSLPFPLEGLARGLGITRDSYEEFYQDGAAVIAGLHVVKKDHSALLKKESRPTANKGGQPTKKGR